MTKQYGLNDEVIGDIDDVTPRFIRNPARSKIRLHQYSNYISTRTRTVRGDYSYGTRTVQYSRSLPSNRTRAVQRR